MTGNENERLEALLKSKQFQELDDEDQNWIIEEIGGERAYEHLREMMLNLGKEGTRKMNPQVKKQLVAELKSRHQTLFGKLFSYRMPVGVAFLIWVFLAFGLYFLIPEKQITVEKPITIETTRVDTLLVQLPADTVFVERKIRVEVPITVAEQKEEKAAEPIMVKGNSLSEQKRLQRLLVSGEEI